jgi:hypothetical protein
MSEALKSQEQLGLNTNPAEEQLAQANAIDAAQAAHGANTYTDAVAGEEASEQTYEQPMLPGMPDMEAVEPAAAPTTETPAPATTAYEQPMLPGMPRGNTERLGVRGLNWTARVAGRVADLSYRVAGFADGVHDAAQANRLGGAANVADMVANGADRVRNAANRVNDTAESASDNLADRRTASQVAGEVMDNIEDKVRAGRARASRLGRAVSGAFNMVAETTKVYVGEKVEANRQRAAERAAAAEQRREARQMARDEKAAYKENARFDKQVEKDHKAALKENARFDKAAERKAAEEAAELERALARENQLTPEEQAAKDEAQQQMIDQQRAAERQARAERNAERRAVVARVAKKTGKVALVSAGVAVALPVAATAAVGAGAGYAAYRGGRAAKNAAVKGYNNTKAEFAEFMDEHHEFRAQQLERAADEKADKLKRKAENHRAKANRGEFTQAA